MRTQFSHAAFSPHHLPAASQCSARTPSSVLMAQPGWQAPTKCPSIRPQEHCGPEAPSSEVLPSNTRATPSHACSPAWDLGVRVTGSGQGRAWACWGLGYLHPLGVRNALPQEVLGRSRTSACTSHLQLTPYPGEVFLGAREKLP